MIGIVGGMGPWATADLVDKIAQETVAEGDQDHVPIVVISAAGEIGDRTAYMESIHTGGSVPNPGIQVADQVRRIIGWGATVVGAPCNTMHLAPILEPVLAAAADAIFVSIVEETVRSLSRYAPKGATVGVIGTAATMKFSLYDKALAAAGFTILTPSRESADRVHREAIYGLEGIKRTPGTISEAALGILESACDDLAERGAGVIVLACTELPIILRYLEGSRAPVVPMVDPTRLLARGLIREYDSTKLRDSTPMLDRLRGL